MYLVTGATGNVGREVVEQLLAQGGKVRVFTRDAAKIAHWGDRVEAVIGDFGDKDSFARAVTGAEAVFLMNGALDGEVFGSLLAAAKAQGSPRIVFLSSTTANDPELVIGKMHKEKEDAIRASGLRGRFLRPGGFMTNSFQWIPTIKSDGIVMNALGAGRFAPIAPGDIAAVAVKALTDATLTEEVFELTGGELTTLPEQVSILAKVLGRPLRSVDVPVEAAVQGLIRNGVPAPVAAAVGKSFEAVRNGHEMAITDTVKRVTGKPPITFEQWARKNASRFA